MTTLITSDLHLNENSRDAHRHDFMNITLPRLLKDNKVTRLIIAGDICDEKDHHSAWLTNKVVDHIWNLSQFCQVVVLKGNHDYIQEDNPFYAFLTRIRNVTWIGKPKQVGLELFLPHTRNHEKDWKASHPELQADWVYCHNTFQGAAVGPRQLQGIPLDVFPNGSFVISGDIHQPQRITHKKTTLMYAGAPYRTDFGDQYNPRVLLLENGTDTPISIPVPGPRKVLIEIENGIQISKEIPKVGDLVKVRVHLHQDEFERWPIYKKEIEREANKHEYVISMIQPIVQQQAKSKKMIDVSRKSDGAQLRAYAKRRGVSDKALETGLKIMEES